MSSSTKDQKQSDAKSKDEEKKTEIVWVNKIKADGGAYKGCPKNDYCQHFVDTSERPQNFIRDYEEEKRFLDYPKLNELIRRKNEVLQKRATPPMYFKCDLKTFDLSTLGKFDVILIDPPIKEYERRAINSEMGITNDLIPWQDEELMNLRVEHISDTCCFLFLWVGSEEGLDFGRQLLKKWNFRRCEDIVWIKTNKNNLNRKRIFNPDNLLQHTKEHCLVGIKGAVKRGADSHFIHANIDTDVIVSEEPPFGSTEKPQELYRIIERFCLGRKRIELFGEDHNIRPGWLTLGKNLTNSNFDAEKYNNWFKGDSCYPEAQGYEGGRFVGCTTEIENLRPRSPVRNQNANFLFGSAQAPVLNIPQPNFYFPMGQQGMNPEMNFHSNMPNMMGFDPSINHNLNNQPGNNFILNNVIKNSSMNPGMYNGSNDGTINSRVLQQNFSGNQFQGNYSMMMQNTQNVVNGNENEKKLDNQTNSNEN